MPEEETPTIEEEEKEPKKGRPRNSPGPMFTQDDLNAVAAAEKRKYQERLSDFEKERETLAKQLEKTTADYTSVEQKLTQAQSDSLRFKIALEQGLPMEIASRLQGDDEEAMKKDAEQLSGLITKPKPALHTGPGRETPEPELSFSDQIRKDAGFNRGE